MLYEVITVLANALRFRFPELTPSCMTATGACGTVRCRMSSRITSYNVCYTKLLRLYLPLADVAFSDELNGMAVGPEGSVLVSNNGGRTWTKLDRVADVGLLSVAAIAKKQQWVVGHNGTILRCDWE